MPGSQGTVKRREFDRECIVRGAKACGLPVGETLKLLSKFDKPKFYLYIISEGDGGPCKVGYSKNPAARLSACQTGNSRHLSVYAVSVPFVHEEDVREAEAEAHRMLYMHYIRREWFNISASDCENFLKRWFGCDKSTD